MLKYLVTVIGVPNPSLTAQNRRSSMINHGGPEEGLIPPRSNSPDKLLNLIAPTTPRLGGRCLLEIKEGDDHAVG